MLANFFKNSLKAIIKNYLKYNKIVSCKILMGMLPKEGHCHVQMGRCVLAICIIFSLNTIKQVTPFYDLACTEKF